MNHSRNKLNAPQEDAEADTADEVSTETVTEETTENIETTDTPDNNHEVSDSDFK